MKLNMEKAARIGKEYRNIAGVLALLVGLVGFVVWDQTRGTGIDEHEVAPVATRAEAQTDRPAPDTPVSSEAEPASDDRTPPRSTGAAVM